MSELFKTGLLDEVVGQVELIDYVLAGQGVLKDAVEPHVRVALLEGSLEGIRAWLLMNNRSFAEYPEQNG